MTIMAALLLVAGCKKDDSTEYAELNISEIVSMIGKDRDYVKKNFNARLSFDETNMHYKLLTKESDYSITFKSNSSGKVTSADVFGSLEKGYGIETYKKISDKINSGISHVAYIAHYGSLSAGRIDFGDRAEFWSYLDDKGISSYVGETWSIENGPKVYFTIDGTYREYSGHTIGFEIKLVEW